MIFREFLLQYGIKIVLTIAAAAIVTVGIFSLINYFNHPSSVTSVKITASPYYDTQTRSVVLANNTASLSGLQNCDIYVSGPNKQMKYFETVSCDSLSSIEISRADLLNLFGNQTGTYTILINSDSKGSILQFSI